MQNLSVKAILITNINEGIKNLFSYIGSINAFFLASNAAMFKQMNHNHLGQMDLLLQQQIKQINTISGFRVKKSLG